MEKEPRTKTVIQEIYLYSNKLEALVKDAIWIISWIGGILILQDATDKKTLGGSYFIFSLSLLMEFAPQINGKKHFWSKILHTLFCGSILVIMLMAIGLLVEVKDNGTYGDTMFFLSKLSMGYIVINFILSWLGEEANTENVSLAANEAQSSSDALAIQKYEESLNGGKLGHIDKGVKHDE